MWRLTGFLRRDPSLTAGEFVDFIEREWAALARANAVLRNVVDRIDIHLPFDVAGTGLEAMFAPQFDALLELWFGDRDGARTGIELINQESGLPRLTDHLDNAASAAWLGEVLPKKPDAARRTRICMTVAGHVIDGMPEHTAQQYWSDVHPLVAQRAPQTWNRLTLYQQTHGRRDAVMESQTWIPCRYRPMCADVGAASVDELLAAYGNDEYLAIVRPDEMKFSKPHEALSFITAFVA